MLVEFLSWLTSSDGGAVILVAAGLSWGLENVEAWHNFSSKQRSIVVLALSVLLGVGATTLQRNPDLVAALDVYFTPAYNAVLAWLTTQGVYGAGKRLIGNKGGDS
jgi:hypothetical protein